MPAPVYSSPCISLYLQSSVVAIKVSHHTVHCHSLIIWGDLSYRYVITFYSVLWEKSEKNVESDL